MQFVNNTCHDDCHHVFEAITMNGEKCKDVMKRGFRMGEELWRPIPIQYTILQLDVSGVVMVSSNGLQIFLPS